MNHNIRIVPNKVAAPDRCYGGLCYDIVRLRWGRKGVRSLFLVSLCFYGYKKISLPVEALAKSGENPA